MRFLSYRDPAGRGLAVEAQNGGWRGLSEADPAYPGALGSLIAGGADALRGAAATLLKGADVPLADVEVLPPLEGPGKIICIGLNYLDHATEAGMTPAAYPTVFARWAASLVGHGAPLVRPAASEQFDFEGEIVAVIGRRARHVAPEEALAHIAGYSIFNDASVRDYQFKSTQWTMGKNFDGTGAFGPVFVTADELPPGLHGARIETRLNGQTMQSATTADMMFDMATLVVELSAVTTLEPGDLIVSGTPAGVGMSRTPPLWMKPGDLVEVEVEGLGVLRNPVVAG